MRDYNFRRSNKRKEQERRKLIYNTGYFPTMPKESEGDNGEIYYVEGSKSNRKQFLKKVANKKVRKSNLNDVKNGGHYRRIFDLPWNWY